MLGRGATGSAVALGEISNALFGTPYAAPTADEKLASMLAQINASVALYGERLGVRVVRKHIAAFVDAWCEDHMMAPMDEVRGALCRLDSSTALTDASDRSAVGQTEDAA
jgi:tRNA-dihydrouridine synthase B